MTPLRARLLATTLLAAIAAPAAAQERGVAALLDQANYWKVQNRPDQVVRTLERVLQVDPRNAEALSGIAEAQAQLGNATAAQEALQRLQQAAPADPRTRAADVAVRSATVDAGALANARALAQQGRNAEAVERYRALFANGVVPDSFALEYYQTLTGTEAGYAEGRDGLARLAQRQPSNTAAQLAYAQVLTYREASRTDGIERLRRLSGQPESQQAALAAWRQALTWLGPGPESIRPLEGYLQQFPNDAEIQRRLEEARNPPAVAANDIGKNRERAWQAFNGNRLRDAEASFTAVLAIDPNDADGLGGLGLIRLRQGNRPEARRLLEAAIAADPSRASSWQRALDGARGGGGPATPGTRTAGGGGTPAAPAARGPDIQTARDLVAAERTEEAEPLLRQILARNGGDRPDAEALLGDVALRRGEPVRAEEFYRAALARRPNFGAAQSGLANALQAQGRFAEAEDINRRLGVTASPELRTDALRAEALRSDDPQAAAALLRTAITNDPSNPWPRLDLARLLARQGRGAEARRLMDDMVANRVPADALHAAAIFASEQGRAGDVVTLLNRIPANVRSQDQNRLLAAATAQAEIQTAAAPALQGRPADARQRLVALASRPDPTGERGPAAVRALLRLNDTRGAQEAARAAMIAARGQPPAVRLSAATALLESGLDQEAARAAQSIETGPLSTEQRRQVANLQAGLAIRTADQLNERGDQASAYEVLAPTLRANPQNTDANLALARLYQGAKDPQHAQRIAEAVLSREPRNTDARQTAMDAAIAARDWNRAEALLAEGRALMPADPRISMLEARLARAYGDGRRARVALETAAQQRRAQIGLDPPGMLGVSTPNGAAVGVPEALPGMQLQIPQQGYENPFRRIPLAGPAQPTTLSAQAQQQQLVQNWSANPPPDPMLNDITRQLREVREESAPRLSPGFSARTRSGDSGLDGLTELSAGAEGSVAVPGVGGRLLARVSAVNLDTGGLQTALPQLRRFGGNPLILPGTNGTLTTALGQRASNVDSSHSGIAVGGAYQRGNFTADIGSTPIGFEQTNMVGGIEIAPEIADGVRLRLTGERRALTDSVLAWSGQRDPAFGRSWGAVTRTGGRAQLEIAVGETNLYLAGGYFQISGTGVADNSRVELGAGFTTPVWTSPTEEITAGIDVVYFAYEKNLRFFTLGHGGYYSPQSFIAANVPVDWRGRSGDLSWRLGGTIGFASFTEDRTEIFPNDPTFQRALVARSQTESDVSAFYPGQTKTGLTAGLRGDLEYALSPSLRLGAALRYDRAADWNEVRGLVYARYRFDR